MKSSTHAAARFSVLLCALCASAIGFSLSLRAQQQPPKKSQPAKKAQNPGPLETLLRQAEQALEKEDFAAAAKALEEYVALRPEDAIAHFHLGYAYTGLNRREDAQREYARAAELDPKMTAAHLNLGLLHLDHDAAAAVRPLSKVVELNPAEARPRYLLGLAHERSGDAKAAIENYTAARNLDAKNFDIRFSLGRVLLASGRAAEAEAEFRSALGMQPDSAPTRLGLAESLVAQDKLDGAAEHFVAYLESNPADHETRLQLAGLYLDIRKDQAALAELDRIEAAGQRPLRLYQLRADAFIRLKRYAEAVISVEKAIELEPKDAALYARLGSLRLELRDFPGAERALIAALTLNPGLTDALRDLVAVYYLSENYPAALVGLDRLAQREELPAGSWFVRATCYDKLGRKAEALAAYKKFVELDQGRSEKQDFQARQRIRIIARELERKR
jgi:Flp pilus assembly protein TadD